MSVERKLVLSALMRMEREEGYSNLVWNNTLENATLSSQQTAFATTLFYGVLERQMTLDYIINTYSKTKTNKMKPMVRFCLRMGVYQLHFMEGVADHAAINETVGLVKKSAFRSLAPFVNGVLRSVQRGGKELQGLESLPLSTALSVQYSVPEDLVAHYITHYGSDLTKELLPAFVGGRPLYLRVNTLKITPQELCDLLKTSGIEMAVHETFENTLQVQGGGNPFATSAYEQGLFYAQDPASGYCCKALSVEPDMRVLDVCAAPGGKSFTLSCMMNNKGELVSCDLYDHKINLMQQGASRLGITCMTPVLRDANSGEDMGKFQRILCDLPCSGLGVLGRKPEIRYKVVTFLDNFPAMQYGMLCKNLQWLQQGGVLVFSTCTLNPKENEENLARLLTEHPDLEPYPILPELPRVLGEEAHYINLLPHVHGTDGFFIGAVRKVEAE